MEDKFEKEQLNIETSENEPTSQVVEEEFVVYKPENEEELSSKEQELSEKVLHDSTRIVMENKSSKGKIFNACLFVVSTLILIGILLYHSNTFGVYDIEKSLFEGLKYRYLFIIFGCFVAIMVFDSLRTHVLLHKSTKMHRPILSYKSTAICRYYDCITPFSFGGQPFQVFYLNSRGVKAGIASSVPMAKYLFSQATFCIVSLVMLILGASYYGDSSRLVVTFSIISLCISFVFLILIIFASVDKKVLPNIILHTTKFLNKIKLVKDYKIAFTKTMRTLLEYQRSVKYYLKSFWTTFLTIILSVGIIALKACIPYFIYVYLLRGQVEASFFVIFSKFIICELATMFIPLPGGSGMAEISFSALFATLFIGENAGYLFWAVLIYRIASYYLYLLQGFLISLYDFVWGNKLNEKFKKGKLIEMQIKAKNRMKNN